MNALILTGSTIAITTYFPLWVGIRSGKAEQNLLTWALWAVLDLVIAGSIITQKGNFLLPIAYFVGSSITVMVIARAKGQPSWTWFESLVSSLVVISMLAWYIWGDRIATIASTTAMLIAGIPQLIDAWKKPRGMPLLVFFAFSVANTLSTIGGSDWSIKESLYPASALAYCVLIVLLSCRKFWLKPTQG